METGTDEPSQFECTVRGTPISSQSGNRDRWQEWKDTVRETAEENWSGAPKDEPLYLKVMYFYAGFDGGIDNDNLVKPIQDAMEGVVYQDDHLIEVVTVIRCNLDEEFTVSKMSPDVARALSRGRDFVHIVADPVPPLEDIP